MKRLLALTLATVALAAAQNINPDPREPNAAQEAAFLEYWSVFGRTQPPVGWVCFVQPTGAPLDGQDESSRLYCFPEISAAELDQQEKERQQKRSAPRRR